MCGSYPVLTSCRHGSHPNYGTGYTTNTHNKSGTIHNLLVWILFTTLDHAVLINRSLSPDVQVSQPKQTNLSVQKTLIYGIFGMLYNFSLY